MGVVRFALMFLIAFLLNINFTVLHSVRNTLAVVDLGSGGRSIALFELFGAIPGAILMTWALATLLKRYSIQKVFFLALFGFLFFFLFFAFGLYPLLIELKNSGLATTWMLEGSSMIFYVMAELWKPALTGVLFWGLINEYTPLEKAKALYAPLMLAPSLGGTAAGPVVALCTSSMVWKAIPLAKELWTHSLILLMIVIAVFGVIAGILYYALWRDFVGKRGAEEKQERSSLTESLAACWKNRDLRLLSWMVISCYIAYSLGEVIFFDILKRQYPMPQDYCAHMAKLSFYNGLLTITFALVLTPYMLKRYRWVVGAMAMPVCLLLTEGLFFVFLRGQFMWMEAAIVFGSIQYCLCRSLKYTLFDASKELVFVSMPRSGKMQGKLIIDGICSRLGRGSAAGLSLGLVHIFGGILPSAFMAGVIAIGMGFSWAIATMRLGQKQMLRV
jgi:AAA family ATP:ADP antiporter